MTFNDRIQRSIRNYSLQNAIRFDGKANPGNVISKVIGQFPELAKEAKQLMEEIKSIVADVNTLSAEEQLLELHKHAPELLEHKQEERHLFGFLNIEKGERVITAFPPEPSKYPHIGHAKAALLNYNLAKEYQGSFYLRFEDTNPELARDEFYTIILNDMQWLGIVPDAIHYASDHMERFYNLAETLINKGHAYVCTCTSEAIKEAREDMRACACRHQHPSEALAAWKNMHESHEGDALLRMKIDMEHKNATMRDPALFRIIEADHARLGKQFRVWPTYDFQNPVMDGITGVTHRLRSKEFELRNELHRLIQRTLGFPETKIYEFARFNMVGVESSGRIIREKIGNGEFRGWDDPRLTTLVALRRRGFQPGAIAHFVMNTGITKSEATLTWDDLIVQNRKIVEPIARRYFFISDPITITIEGSPKFCTDLHLNPNEKKGGRPFSIDGSFIVSSKDLQSIEDGELVRLMECLNFRRRGKQYVFESKEHSDFKGHGKRLIHWLPANTRHFRVKIMKNDLSIIQGLAEHNLEQIKEGEVIQFERFGFCRLDAIEGTLEEGTRIFWYTHQ